MNLVPRVQSNGFLDGRKSLRQQSTFLLQRRQSVETQRFIRCVHNRLPSFFVSLVKLLTSQQAQRQQRVRFRIGRVLCQRKSQLLFREFISRLLHEQPGAIEVLVHAHA